MEIKEEVDKKEIKDLKHKLRYFKTFGEGINALNHALSDGKLEVNWESQEPLLIDENRNYVLLPEQKIPKELNNFYKEERFLRFNRDVLMEVLEYFGEEVDIIIPKDIKNKSHPIIIKDQYLMAILTSKDCDGKGNIYDEYKENDILEF